MLEGLAYCKWCHPWTDGQELYKQADSAKQSNPVSSAPPWHLLQFLIPGSCLSSYPDFSSWLAVIGMSIPKKPFSLQLVLTMIFYHRKSLVQLDKTGYQDHDTLLWQTWGILFMEGLWSYLLLWAKNSNIFTDRVCDLLHWFFHRHWNFHGNWKGEREKLRAQSSMACSVQTWKIMLRERQTMEACL